MFNPLKKLRDYFDPPQSGEVDFKYYKRTGACHGCGQCCSGIYLVHGDEVISSVPQFEALKPRHPDYRHFVPIEENDSGVVFRCMNLQEDNSCGIYDDRPLFCKKYPTEATLLYGGKLAPQCGFLFQTRQTFTNVLQKTAKKKSLKPGKLLNDATPFPIPKGGLPSETPQTL